MLKTKDSGGILYPAKMKRRSWIVAGPPGSGKSFLIKRIGGYPGEIGVDVTMKKWWSIQALAERPREIHFALPFQGYKGSTSVYDDKWKEVKKLPELKLEKIRIPHKKKFVLAPDWRARFVFDFILPPPLCLFKIRRKRKKKSDLKLVDMALTSKWIEWQVHTHWKLAWHFHSSGLQVLVRPFNLAYPYEFSEITRTLTGKKDAGLQSVFPKGVDMGFDLSLIGWIKAAAPKDWRRSIKNSKS